MYRSDSELSNLLQCFFKGCEQRFRFLEDMHGFRYVSGLAEYRRNCKIIRPYAGQDVPTDFIALTRYERANQAVEIVFGDGNYIIEGYVYADPVRRFEFSEILAAAKKNYRDVSGEWGATEPRMVDDTLERFSLSLRQYVQYFTNLDENILAEAEAIRHKRIENAVRTHFTQHIAQACLQAAKAFLNKDYVRVVSILQPLEMYLDNADLKKLKLAKQYILA